MSNVILSSIKKVFAYSKLQADGIIDEAKKDPKVTNFSLKERTKKGETFYVITIEETYNTIKELTQDFGM